MNLSKKRAIPLSLYIFAIFQLFVHGFCQKGGNVYYKKIIYNSWCH